MAAEKKKKPAKRKSKYLDKTELLEEVIECQKYNVMSDKLAKMLMLLTLKYATSPQFAGYTFNEDMQSYALMMLVKTWAGFNVERSDNAFAYYTQCIKSSFKQFLNKEKVQRVVRDELLVSKGLNPSYSYQSEHSQDNHYVYDEEDHGQILTDQYDLNKTKEQDFIS